MMMFAYLILALILINSSGIHSQNISRSPPILAPIPFAEEINDVKLDHSDREVLISITVHNGTVNLEDKPIAMDALTSLTVDATLESTTKDGVTSRHKVCAEAQTYLSEIRECEVLIYNLQIAITAIDNEKVICDSIPQIRLFLGNDGEEKRRVVTYVHFNDSNVKKEITKLIQKEDPNSATINPTPVLFSNDLLLNDEPLLFEPAIEKIINTKSPKDPLDCGCSDGCEHTDSSICSQLPPAMRLAICAVLLCLAAFLLMLFAHVFVTRPSTNPTSSLKSSSMYARNVRVAWAYMPNYRKEVCA